MNLYEEFPECDWKHFLDPSIFDTIDKNLEKILSATDNDLIYPPRDAWFKAFATTPLKNTKVVVIGQDPYHQKGQAMGLVFSVNNGVKIPPSLRNIYKELKSDLNIENVKTDLTPLASQGVLLMNTILTVEDSKPLSHKNIGWEIITTEIIKVLNREKNHLVFLLWGSPAQSYEKYIDHEKHLILKTVHPSPLSAFRGFFGCHHFSKTNAYLEAHGETPIDFAIR